MNDTIKNKWIMNGLLAVILVLLIGNYARNHALPTAQAAGGGWETNGVMILPVSGVKERFILVDTKNLNICVYNARPNGSFGLTGARSYKYDVEIEDTEKIKIGNGLTYVQVKTYHETKK